MNIIIWIILLQLLNVKYALGLDARRTVLFPDESDENSNDFIYGNAKVTQMSTSKTKRPTANHPKSKQKTNFRIDTTDIPCANTTMIFCEEVTNQAYPMKYVESVLAKTDAQTYENYFNKTLPNESLELRMSNKRPIELCDSFTRLIHPQLAMSVQNNWHYIINQPSYQQPIRVEICRKKKAKCLFNESFPSNYVSSCVQKYTKVPLLSLGEDGELVPYDYEFPSFCQCELNFRKPGKISGRRRH